MTCDAGGIDMVLPKWSYKGLGKRIERSSETNKNKET